MKSVFARSRRFFLAKFLATAGTASLFSAVNTKHSPFIDEFRVRSKDTNKTYKNADEFWLQHTDEVAVELNNYFIRKGWLLSCDSILLKDKKTVRTKKIYLNKDCFNLYLSAWKQLSLSKSPLEHGIIHYSNYKRYHA